MNDYRTDEYQGLQAEFVPMQGHNGDEITAYMAKPLTPGPHPGVVLIHHLPGWDDLYREFTLRFARKGYVAICPNLYHREAHGTPLEVGTAVREAGGVSDAQVVGDVQGAMAHIRALPEQNGKVGVIGSCSGGRHAFLVGCQTPDVDAVAELWGGGVVMPADQLSEKRPVAPIDMTADLQAPVIGIFGNDDQAPSPEQVDQHEEALKQAGKDYEFHRYDGAGHGFFYYDRANYRQEQAVDAWDKVWAFFGKHLA
ncbi:MAG: dienelactone hydrolase family protein [Dehalococcoidia bacterium]